MLALPDVPRWVEAHGIAADPDGWRESIGGGLALGHDLARLIVLAGEVSPEAACALAHARPGHTLLYAIERADLTAALAAHGRTSERAVLHDLPEPDALPEREGAVLLGEHALGELPAVLAGELAWERARGPVWTAWLDGAPASFAYAPWRSARWFDVSVDTLPGARQLGLATVVAATMIRDERARGREPVWGADEDNHASLALARVLGFRAGDELWVAAGRA